MHKRLMILLIFSVAVGCGPQVQLLFVDVGNEEYMSKPSGYDIQVFSSDLPPQREYKVIGMIFLEDESGALIPHLVSDPQIVNLFKKEARKQGADAIIVERIASDTDVVPDPSAPLDFGLKAIKRAEAKAIVFTDDNNAVKSNKEHMQ